MNDDRKLNKEIRMPLMEEELVAKKTVHEIGQVRITKKTVTEYKQMSVAVRREELHVENLRVPEGALESPEAGEKPFEDATWVIPLYQERVEVVTRPFLREEVRITRRAREDLKTLGADVRRQDLEVTRVAPERVEKKAG